MTTDGSNYLNAAFDTTDFYTAVGIRQAKRTPRARTRTDGSNRTENASECKRGAPTMVAIKWWKLHQTGGGCLHWLPYCTASRRMRGVSDNMTTGECHEIDEPIQICGRGSTARVNGNPQLCQLANAKCLNVRRKSWWFSRRDSAHRDI